VLATLAAAAALVCLDPGHGTDPAVGAQREPIAPGSSTLKVKDPGGAPGEAAVVLEIAKRTRTELRARGFGVVMTRDRDGYRGGNIARAQLCNRNGAALMLRIHADGSTDASRHGAATLYPPGRAASLRAARAVQRAVVGATGARDLGLVPRTDLTGFNWARIPAVLVETGFVTNPREGRLLRAPAYQARVARGLAAGVEAFLTKRTP
jgi:N-acetylmuramoyl-L-alanine amidase